MNEQNELLKTGSCLKEAKTPNINLKMVQHKIDLENEEIKFNHENYWVSCCLKTDKRAILYFTQAGLSACICAFTISMMVINQDCSTFARWSSLLSLVVGIWCPNPKLNNK